jgi:hypothetical protein
MKSGKDILSISTGSKEKLNSTTKNTKLYLDMEPDYLKDMN